MASRASRLGLLQWGHVFSDVEMCNGDLRLLNPSTASMGPRLFRRGNLRGFLLGTVFPKVASMGPRLFRRGNNLTGADLSWADLASMGPRLFRRGNIDWAGTPDPGTRGFNGATSFQTWK